VPTLKSVQFVTKKGAIAFDSCNNRFYTYNPKTLTWSQVSGGGGSTDTTSLSNRINLKIDSIKSRNDSVFAYRNGNEVFQYKDTTIGTLQSVTNKGNTTTNAIYAEAVYANLGGGAVLGDDGVVTAQSISFVGGGTLQSYGTSSLFLPNYSDTLVGKDYVIDTLKRTNDSIFAYKNHQWVFQFKDSIGGGGGAFLPLTGGTLTGNLTGTTATFSSNGSSNTFNINHTSGSGNALEITKGGNGEGLIVNKTSGSGNAVTITGTLNATTIVKNGGTSSQFLKADGSVDATDTSVFQRKQIAANSIQGNNTSAAANATNIFFKDTSGTYTGTITWGGTAPTSLTASYRWVRIGRRVDLNITLVYANAGTTNTTLLLTIPSDAPTPAEPSGATGNSNYLYPTYSIVNTNLTTLTNSQTRGGIRKNSGGSGYEIFMNFTSLAASTAYVTATYFTN
jgi:hypothetical protein